MDVVHIISELIAGVRMFVGTIVPYLFVLTLVVFVHELGHALVARWCGVRVDSFSIGFGRELLGFTDRRGTRWRIAALPFGGLVTFADPPDPGSFEGQGVGRRAAIAVAGPLANFLLAVAIFAASLYVAGRPVLAPRIAGLEENGPGARAGFKTGDLVVAMNGQAIHSFLEMQRIVSTRGGEPLAVVVERDGSRVEFVATPAEREVATPFGRQRIGQLGLFASRNPADLTLERYGVWTSVRLGALEAWNVVAQTGDYAARLFAGRESMDQLSGPLRIAQVSGVVAQLGGLPGLVQLAALLSVSVGLLNLLPIPMLDGGHLMFYAIEAVRGRPLSARAQQLGVGLGLVVVIAVTCFVTWNDLMQFAKGA